MPGGRFLDNPHPPPCAALTATACFLGSASSSKPPTSGENRTAIKSQFTGDAIAISRIRILPGA